jgi:hypothetical protein
MEYYNNFNPGSGIPRFEHIGNKRDWQRHPLRVTRIDDPRLDALGQQLACLSSPAQQYDQQNEKRSSPTAPASATRKDFVRRKFVRDQFRPVGADHEHVLDVPVIDMRLHGDHHPFLQPPRIVA